MGKVIWTEPVLADLQEIVLRISEDSPANAEEFGLKLAHIPCRLADFPRMGRVVPEYGSEDVRELIFGNYRLIYQIRADVCYVVAVIHASRDILRHLDPGEWNLG